MENGRGKKVKDAKPDRLLFIGEIMSIRAPGFKCVAEARAGLKEILQRHLAVETHKYPVGLDENKCIRYDSKIADGEQQAFNAQAQQRLNVAAGHLTKILFGHNWEFGIVGAALDNVRESGIMPPNLFRYLRFCRETRSLWWFVQNLGAPSAYPENAALMEHYNAERMTGVALLRPYIKSSITGLKAEAEKYLTEETKDELVQVLGRSVLLDLVRKRRDDARSGLTATGRDEVRNMVKSAYDKDFISNLPPPKKGGEADKDGQDRQSANAASPPRAPDLQMGDVDPVDAAAAVAEQTERQPWTCCARTSAATD